MHFETGNTNMSTELSQGLPQQLPVLPPGYMLPGLQEQHAAAAVHQQATLAHFLAMHSQAEALRKLWADIGADIEKHSTELADFKAQQLPLARIRKIMKSDQDVRMISADALVLFARACEMFILDLTMRAWGVAQDKNHKTLAQSDLATAVWRTELLRDFLVDVVPKAESNIDEQMLPAAPLAVGQLPAPVPGAYQPPLAYSYLPPGYVIPTPPEPTSNVAGSVHGHQQQSGEAAAGQQQQHCVLVHPGLFYPPPPGMWAAAPPPGVSLLQQPLPPGSFLPVPASQQQRGRQQ